MGEWWYPGKNFFVIVKKAFAATHELEYRRRAGGTQGRTLYAKVKKTLAATLELEYSGRGELQLQKSRMLVSLNTKALL